MRTETKKEVKAEVAIKVTKARYEECKGTSYQGDMFATYQELVKVFGQPYEGDGCKIQAEWVGKIFGMTFTIYDYKDDAPVDKVKTWHIGGNDKAVVELVKAYYTGMREVRA